MTATLTFNDDDNYLADVAERLAALGELPSLPDPMPTWGELVAWVARGRCPRDAKSEAERRCRALYGWTTLGQLSDFELGTNIPELVLEASVPLAMLKIEEADEENDGKIDVLGATQSEWGWIPGAGEERRDWAAYQIDEEMQFSITVRPLEVIADLTARNEHLQVEDRLISPLFPIINAFLQHHTPVKTNRRPYRIIPARIAMAYESDRRMPERFSPPAHVQRTKGGQMLIPGFECDWAPSPALPLALYDLGGGPNDGKGEGAPLALRIFVESVLALHQEDRNGTTEGNRSPPQGVP